MKKLNNNLRIGRASVKSYLKAARMTPAIYYPLNDGYLNTLDTFFLDYVRLHINKQIIPSLKSVGKDTVEFYPSKFNMVDNHCYGVTISCDELLTDETEELNVEFLLRYRLADKDKITFTIIAVDFKGQRYLEEDTVRSIMERGAILCLENMSFTINKD